jgi:uncharacterized membrane protein
MPTMLCKMSNKLRIQYGASVGISVICIMMLLVFLYGRIIQQIYNHFQVRNYNIFFDIDQTLLLIIKIPKSMLEIFS